MVNDKEVKASVSPFAVREGEKKIFDGKDGFASINQVVFKMDMGYINESHIKVLEVVNEFEFVTSRQVTQILEERGKLNDTEPEKRQDKVSKWLEDLSKSKVLSRYYFQNELGKSSYRVYALDNLATYLLNERNITVNWQKSDNSKPAYALKRKLAGNQIIIAYMQKVAAYVDAMPSVILYSKKYGVKFKPTGGMIKLKKDDQTLDYIFEVVRRNEDWQNMFAEKVQLFSDFYENFAKNDCGFLNLPQLVFVGEDIKHLAEMFRVIKKVTSVLKDEDMYFTTETKHLADDLTDSMDIFELDKNNNKYKLTTKTLDILAPGDNNSNGEISKKLKFNPNMIVE